MYVPRRITSGQLNINQNLYSQKAPPILPSKVSYGVYIVRVLEKFDHIITRSQHIHVNPHHNLFCDINVITSSVQYVVFRKRSLNCHLFIHNGVKQYHCKSAIDSFQRRLLWTPIILKCVTCCFQSRFNLNSHLRQHTVISSSIMEFNYISVKRAINSFQRRLLWTTIITKVWHAVYKADSI